MALPSWRRSSGWNTLLGNSLARVCRQQCQSPCVPWSGAGPSSRTKPGSRLVLIPVVSFQDSRRCLRVRGGEPRKPRWKEGSRRPLYLPSRHGPLFGMDRDRPGPWHKNDNCYVESKNWTLVRRCLG
jgi:hypothetical protein